VHVEMHKTGGRTTRLCHRIQLGSGASGVRASQTGCYRRASGLATKDRLPGGCPVPSPVGRA
jgi:hypothetical protein